jgi:squalene synthase HpnC
MDSATTATGRLRAREAGENFPVALRLLPSRPRLHLHAVYATVRLIDDTGDLAQGDRVAQLLALRSDLARVWHGGEPDSPVLRALSPTVAACGLSQEPFQQLVEANLMDQRVTTYGTFDDLLGYCRLSAEPIGRIVLAIFDQATPVTTALSDRVCSALQVLEHCQDVAEDYAAGRIYLPECDLAHFSVPGRDLAAGGRPSPRRRAVVERQVDRSARLLDQGAALVGQLTGWARIAVAAYVAGGYATVRALRATECDVWSTRVTPRRTDMLRSMARQLGRTMVASR